MHCKKNCIILLWTLFPLKRKKYLIKSLKSKYFLLSQMTEILQLRCVEASWRFHWLPKQQTQKARSIYQILWQYFPLTVDWVELSLRRLDFGGFVLSKVKAVLLFFPPGSAGAGVSHSSACAASFDFCLLRRWLWWPQAQKGGWGLSLRSLIMFKWDDRMLNFSPITTGDERSHGGEQQINGRWLLWQQFAAVPPCRQQRAKFFRFSLLWSYLTLFLYSILSLCTFA